MASKFLFWFQIRIQLWDISIVLLLLGSYRILSSGTSITYSQMYSRSKYSEQYLTHRIRPMKERNVVLRSPASVKQLPCVPSLSGCTDPGKHLVDSGLACQRHLATWEDPMGRLRRNELEFSCQLTRVNSGMRFERLWAHFSAPASFITSESSKKTNLLESLWNHCWSRGGDSDGLVDCRVGSGLTCFNY